MIDYIENIKNKNDFTEFLEMLANDFKENKNDWQNKTINEYIEACAAWIEDYSNAPNNDIGWQNIDYKILAKIFYMGKYYE